VGFDDSAHNELEPARRVAERYGTRHHAEILQPGLEEMLERVLQGTDEPFADSSAIPSRFVPGAPGRSVCRGLARVWPRSPHLPRSLRLGTVLENVGRDPADAYYADLCFLKPWDARLLLGTAPDRDPRKSPVYELVTDPYRRCPSPSVVQKAQYADLMVYLPNDPLVKVDRMSMLHSLEVRCPLLDHRVVELAFRVPTSTKMPGLRAKHLLRRLAERRLPAQNLDLPKRGFTAPVARWLAGPASERFAWEVLGDGGALGGLLDLHVLRRWLDEHRRGRADRSYALWAVWVLDRWARRERDTFATALPSALARTG
jgi:asparagine synthase (glutamine-hydrolysing)